MAGKKNPGGYEQKYGDVFLTGIVTLHYPCLDEARIDENYPESGAKYKATLFVDKTDKETISIVHEKTLEVTGMKSIEQVRRTPFMNDDEVERDGDDPKYFGKPGHAGRKWIITSARDKPHMFILGEDNVPVEVTNDNSVIRQEFYAGCKVRASIQLSEYKKGKVCVYILGLIKVDEGERLGSPKPDIKNMFLAAVQGIKPNVNAGASGKKGNFSNVLD